MLQALVDQNLTIILKQRPTVVQDCRHQKVLVLSTMEHLIISSAEPHNVQTYNGME